MAHDPPKKGMYIHRGDMCLARHKGRKKTLALPNRPKPLGVIRSLTDEFVRTGNGKRGTGNGERGEKFSRRERRERREVFQTGLTRLTGLKLQLQTIL